MHARVASFENANLGLIDDLIGTVRERVASGRNIPGAHRLLMLVDREGGTALGITLFETEEALRESEAVFERLGDEIPEAIRGRRTSVERYEVLVDEIEEGAKAARVSTLEGPLDTFERGISYARETIFPSVKQLAGFTGVLFMVDRATGRAKTVTFWDSEDSLRQTEDAANDLRKQAADAGDETIVGVDRYEVALSEVPSPV